MGHLGLRWPRAGVGRITIEDLSRPVGDTLPEGLSASLSVSFAALLRVHETRACETQQAKSFQIMTNLINHDLYMRLSCKPR